MRARIPRRRGVCARVACWKTYVGRPETAHVRGMAINQLGNGLSEGKQSEDALSVREVELSLARRRGADEDDILIAQGNIAITYHRLGRLEEANRMLRDVYSGRLKLKGKEHPLALAAANNYADSLLSLQRLEEAKSLYRKTIPVARRVVGDDDELTLMMRQNYARALHKDPDATLNDFREAVAILEETERIAQRVLGGSYPLAISIEFSLRRARTALRDVLRAHVRARTTA